MMRVRLIEEKGYTNHELPVVRTIGYKMNDLNFHPQTVAKCKPVKKIKETDAIFEQIFKINKETDNCGQSLRLSIDAKAKVKIGPFSRGGKNRQGANSVDHDFGPKKIVTPLGFFLPLYDETFLYFTESKVTADFIVDCLERLWPNLKKRFSPLLEYVHNGRAASCDGRHPIVTAMLPSLYAIIQGHSSRRPNALVE